MKSTCDKTWVSLIWMKVCISFGLEEIWVFHRNVDHFDSRVTFQKGVSVLVREIFDNFYLKNYASYQNGVLERVVGDQFWNVKKIYTVKKN